eukprot:gnl/Chilomastix_cuspidata/205.p4 GENE.gnl/Chilomastix_cuspidata/205~~gnl/Chilomastix_cuspidata/205.p4  ORF type:complete len:154 (-),score=61.34 gnl/Chilomastix_cuspidata/205:1023-1484(-)
MHRIRVSAIQLVTSLLILVYTTPPGRMMLVALLLIACALCIEELTVETFYMPETCDMKARAGDTVHVDYIGRLLSNGDTFDSSYNRGTPIVFTLGAGQVIQGWELGLEDCCVGERRNIQIPARLGYGARRVGPIPPNADLEFDVELVKIDRRE